MYMSVKSGTFDHWRQSEKERGIQIKVVAGRLRTALASSAPLCGALEVPEGRAVAASRLHSSEWTRIFKDGETKNGHALFIRLNFLWKKAHVNDQ